MAEMTQEQVREMQLECTPNISTATRQVQGGYIVTGRIVWVNDDGTPRGVQQDECVCSHYSNIGAAIVKYHERFTFTFGTPAIPVEK